jgi:hypothetical protein
MQRLLGIEGLATLNSVLTKKNKIWISSPVESLLGLLPTEDNDGH